MGQTGSHHGSNRVESWIEQGQIMSHTGSKYGSNKDKSWVDRVESWVA